MSTALTLHQPDSPTVTTDQMELIKKTIAKDATPDQLKMFLYDCHRQGVHPLDKLIHFTNTGGKYTPITSIDFMRSRAADSMEYAGNDDPQFDMGTDGMGIDGKYPRAATVTVYRLVQGQRCAFSATARWSEYLPQNAFMWKKMPFTMLGKCAEALALRKAFPRQLAGLYSSEEMDQARKAKDGESVTWEGEAEKQAIVDRKLKELKHDEPATDADEIERWKTAIVTCDTAADFNAMIPKVKDKPNVIKMALMTEAVNKGFQFDRQAKEFASLYPPEPAEAPQTRFEQEMESEPAEPHSASPAPSPRATGHSAVAGKPISIAQAKRLWAIAREKGVSKEVVMEMCGQHGFESVTELTYKPYNEIVTMLQQYVGGE